MSEAQDLYDKAMSMSSVSDENYIDLARTLRNLLEVDPAAFQKFYEKSKVDRRKAYYLVAIDKAFRKLGIPKARLARLGWTKANHLAKHITPQNADELIKKAEELTTRQLARYLHGDNVLANAHTVTFYFTPKDFKEMESILLKYGATPSSRNAQSREKALMKALKDRRDK